MVVSSTTCTVVWKASNVTGASMPFNADLERIVLKMAHVEWKSTTKAIRRLEGGGRASGASLILERFYFVIKGLSE